MTHRPRTLAFAGPGAVLLLSCYELGHQPLGIAWPRAFLERAGFAPDQIDLAVEPFDDAKVRRAAFVGIAVPMHTALRLGVRAAERIRRINPHCFICFYGLYAHLNADYLLEQWADAVLGGEFEGPLVALVERLAGVGAVGGAGVPDVERGRAAALQRLRYPIPSRDALPRLERYVHLSRGAARTPAGYVEASRGCLHECLHCPITPIYGGRFFVVPHDVVLEDIRRLVAAGAGHITFGDPDFLNGPGHALKLARALHAEHPSVTYDFTVKVEHILEHRSLFPEFAGLGCAFVVSAVESLSDTVLANLEKGHTRADVADALQVVRDVGISLRPSLVAFTPWTTLQDYVDLLDFVVSENLVGEIDPVQYAIRLLVPPGSALLSRAAIQPFLGALDPARFTYHWTHPDPRMDHLYRAVSRVVEAAARVGEDPAVTLGRVRECAVAVGGGDGAGHRPGLHRTGGAPPTPRLTEPWFCCAEPTEQQLGSLDRDAGGWA